MSFPTTADAAEQGRAPLPLNSRKDLWWVQSLGTVIILAVFIVYSSFRAFEGNFYDTIRHAAQFGNRVPLYLSPFYSPPIQNWFPNWFKHVPISPSLYILVFPLSFRLTCYYCRRAYYRAIFMDPPACATDEPLPRKNYTGETKFPLNLWNLHRFAMYAALLLVAFHWKHEYDAFFVEDPAGNRHFGFGMGTIVLGFDTVMLTLYVFSCHSLRHLLGGMLNFFSRHKMRYKIWKGLSYINEHHGVFFWLSLISVGLADLYVRLVTSGLIHDIRIF